MQELIQITSRSETMTKTLQIALASLLIIGSFCSLSMFEYPLGQSRPYLFCLYTSVTWSYLTYSYYYSYYIDSWDNKMSDWIEIITIITTITSILVNYFYFKVKILKYTHSLLVSNII